jgi:hypothetical protein
MAERQFLSRTAQGFGIVTPLRKHATADSEAAGNERPSE